MPSKLYVGNLAYSVTSGELETLFSEAGAVESASVVTDKFSGQSKGFGFVEMADAAGAAQAIERFNDTEFKGRRLKVDEARPKERSFNSGGGGGGGERRRNGGGGGGGGRRWA